MISEAARMRAGALVRRHRVATIVLALVAGLGAAVPMATWAAGRRTAVAVDQFIARADAPDLLLDFCPEGVEPRTADAVDVCTNYVPSSELGILRSMPRVRDAALASWSVMRLATAPEGPFQIATLIQLDSPGYVTWSGEPVVVSGRLPDPDAPDELLVSDNVASALGVGAGTRMWVSGPENGSRPFSSTVVGVVRTVGELVPQRSTAALASGNPMFHAGAAWSTAHGDNVLRRGNTVGVRLVGEDREAFVAALGKRLPGRVFNVSDTVDPALIETTRQATGYESNAAAGIALATAIIAVFLVAQAVARQSRRESDDRAALVALGATRRDLAAAASMRWSIAAGIAVVVSAVTVVAASALGPIGIGRRGPWEPGLAVDWVVLVVGLPVVGLLVIAAGVVPTVRRASARALGVGVTVPGPPPIGAGVTMALRGVRRGAGVPILSAVGGIAAAVAVLVAVAAGSVAIRDVTSHPARYGADFDAIVGFFDDPGGLTEVEARSLVAGHPDVVAASGLPGSTVRTDHGELWVQAFVPIDGAEPVRPVITSGREPTRPDEIALGSLTMREAGLQIGDVIELRPLAGNRPPATFRVVGTTMVTDNWEPRVGAGGVLDPAGLERIAPEASGGITVRVIDGPGREAALARVQEEYPDQFQGVAVPTSLQNVERIAELPVAIAAATAALAAVTLTHALLVCLRSQRRELAVYKSLGFTRRQVIGAVTTEATILALAGLAFGIPLGLIAARSGWRAIAGGLGLSAEASIPIGVVAGSVLGVLLVANLAAAIPGWRAGRIPVAEALRTE